MKMGSYLETEVEFGDEIGSLDGGEVISQLHVTQATQVSHQVVLCHWHCLKIDWVGDRRHFQMFSMKVWLTKQSSFAWRHSQILNLSLISHIPVIESIRILQLPRSKHGGSRRCLLSKRSSFIHLPSGVDFTVVRDSVILLERKPLPRLHLTTGATALLECKVRKVLVCHFTFKLLNVEG